MNIEPLKIKTQDNYNWDDIIYINDFDEDSLEIIKRESKIVVNIYYIKYSNLRPFYFVINRLIGYIEEIKGSSDKYLVVLSSSRNKNINRALDKIWESIDDQINPNIKIKDCVKFRFNSDIDLPLNTTIEFHLLVINVSCIIEKDHEYYPEIYLDECLYNTLWATPAKLVNLLDFKPEKLSIKTENDESSTIITHQVRYENGGFYLTIDNIKGYFSFNKTVLLNMIFSNDDQKINIIKYGKKFLKLLIMEMEN